MIWGFQVGENLRKQLNENTIVAYKFLKYQDLKFWIEDESIKIDALSTYASVESVGGFGDPQEINYKEITSLYIKDEHKDSLLEQNLRSIIGQENFKSNCFVTSFQPQLPDRYVYCLSSEFNKQIFQRWRILQGYDCAIKITDLSRFLLEVQKADIRGERRLGAPAYADLVDYVQTPIDLESYYLADPYKQGMIKDIAEFEWQSELRVRWPLPPSSQATPYFLKIPNLRKLIEVIDFDEDWKS